MTSHMLSRIVVAIAGTLFVASSATYAIDEAELKAQIKQKMTSESTPQDELDKRVDTLENKLKKDPVKPIKRMAAFDFSNAKAIESDDGTMVFVGGNGRYAIVGEIVDVWQKKPLKSVEAIEASTKTIPVNALGLNPKTMNAFSLGEGKAVVSLFVDPYCGWCHELAKTVQASAALLKTYRFDFYVVPALGDASDTVAKHLACSGLSNEAKMRAFMEHGKAFEGKALPTDCDLKAYGRTLVVSQLMGIKSVPLIIAPDGRFSRGMPHDLAAFLAGAKD